MEPVTRSLSRNLVAFAVTSIGAGTWLALTRKDQTQKAFGQQTAAWGAVNLAVAGALALRATPKRDRLRQVLLVNAVADLGYVAVGATVAAGRSPLGGPITRVTPEQARGHGTAAAVQGAVLFALDLGHALLLK